MNILAIDVGNSRVAVGACQDGKVLVAERVAVADVQSALPAAAGRVKASLSAYPAPRVVVSSVNAAAAEAAVAAVRTAVDWPVLAIGQDIELPITLDIDKPETVGVDRLLMAAAAYEAVGGATVVACFGTALTINVVNDAGHFVGGVICPGLRIGARILHEATAALPEVELAAPASPLAQNTVEAIQAGLFYQAAGTVREVVERVATELGNWPHLVFTGGDAELIAPAYEFVDSIVPNLSLMGINLAYRKHVEAQGGKR